MPEFDDCFNRELAEWFALRKGVWSGTAAELLAALQTRSSAGKSSLPKSARVLYAHLESSQPTLRSLGIDVRLQHGSPRMLSLQLCPAEKAAEQPLLPLSGIPSSPALFDGIQSADELTALTPSKEEKVRASATWKQNTSAAKPDSAARFVSGRYAEKESRGGRVFNNTGEALSAVAEMRDRIKEQNLGLQAATELVIDRTQEITQCCGTVVGFLQQDTVLYAVRTGIGATVARLDLQANFFQSCVRTGGALQLRDARRHPLLGAMCQLEGIGSLVIVPIFHHRQVVGAMEFFYRETRSFSTGQIMDLELVAGVISERLSAAAELKQRSGLHQEVGSKMEEQHDCTAKVQSADKAKPPISDISESALLDSVAFRLTAAPNRLGQAMKRVWMQAVPLVQGNVDALGARAETAAGRTEPTKA